MAVDPMRQGAQYLCSKWNNVFTMSVRPRFDLDIVAFEHQTSQCLCPVSIGLMSGVGFATHLKLRRILTRQNPINFDAQSLHFDPHIFFDAAI